MPSAPARVVLAALVVVLVATTTAVACLPVPSKPGRPDLTLVYGRGLTDSPVGRPYQEVVADCEGHGLEACVELSARVDAEGEPDERHVRLTRYQVGCEESRFAADCYRLGAMQRYSRHMFAPMRKACEGGVPHGCFALGAFFFDYGRHDIAFDQFRRACDGHYAPGCLWAGQLLEATQDDQDPKEAARLYTRGCSLGLKPSCLAYRELACAERWTNEACPVP